ncbi:hypothetical protein BKA62DRAFT_715252, partial [Auriculariales sp. MPI-PUGE-AT-0066]
MFFHHLVPMVLDLPSVYDGPGGVHDACLNATLAGAVRAVRLYYGQYAQPYDGTRIVDTLNSCTNLRRVMFRVEPWLLLSLLRQSWSLDDAAWTHSAEVLMHCPIISGLPINHQMVVLTGIRGMRHLQCKMNYSTAFDREPAGVAQLLPYTDRLTHLDIGAQTWLAILALEKGKVGSVDQITL